MIFIGTETEYGISTPSAPLLSPIISSTHAVVGYATSRGARRGTQWDFGPETPLRDARGFDLRRYHTAPTIDPHALGVANLVLGNGGRFYVDHAHPEVSSPETADPFYAMVLDQAGDRVALDAIAAVAELSEAGISALDKHEPCPPLKLYKNNVDGKGASYGSHENYRYSRAVPFDELAAALIPFFVTRQVVTGAGRVGLGPHGDKPGFQISQRADYIEQEISLETTLNRGIINTRDESHTDDEHYGRLHVIIGDASMSQISSFLKLGMTSLVIAAIQRGERFSDLALAHPVAEVSAVSRDLTLSHRLELADGRRLTALEILGEYRRRAAAAVGDGVDKRLLSEWDEAADLLATNPLAAADRLDWVAKYALMKGFVARGASWDHPKIALVDLQYSDIDPRTSLYHALVRKQRMRTLVDEETIRRAAYEPPTDSRAYTRGMFMTRYPDEVVGANWDRVVVAEGESMLTVPMVAVDGYTRADTAAAFEQPTAAAAARMINPE
ncbi:depupylase/deamidase Dop [Corynebacterium sp. TAE3-ERU2]|uniref:depupylase/deamidase Dop n=1 Tax=Corynebacterium sp. TAE3-ERU2 TaxID=2849497 RepID=UPI001C459C27|nr:depupylase/deamidase Dop [Corynebacterium sp. TAE3-ERU2]MBV7302595.1 proteasome accessory factor PafA2 [Corynebacterium sp. TAE3-ERU2]